MKIALVLGAGGHPGYPFQLAVLGAIEERLGLDLRTSDLIVGTSVGAMTGLLLRAGFGIRDLLAIAHGEAPGDEAAHLLHNVLDPPGALPPALPAWRPPVPTTTGTRASVRLLAGRGRRRHNVPAAAAGLLPRGRASHHVFGQAADSLFAQDAWPDLPTWVVAMRTRDGRRTVFGRDELVHTVGEATMASCAIPGWFSPVDIAGVRYVDAGVRSTTNADLVAEHPGEVDLAIVVPPLAIDRPRTAVLDAPLRWLVNAQLRDEVRALEAAGIRTLVATPDADVARSMQGDPINMTPERIARVLDKTATFASNWVNEHLPVPAIPAIPAMA